MDVDQVEGENKDSDNTLETTALFVTQYIQSTSTSLRKDLYKLLPFFCQFVGKNFGSFTGCSLSEWFILSVNDQSCIFTFGRRWRPKTEKYLAEAECWHFLKLLSICLICSFNLNFDNPFLMKPCKNINETNLISFLIHKNPAPI